MGGISFDKEDCKDRPCFILLDQKHNGKLTGWYNEEQQQDGQKKKLLSVSSHAFKLFLEGKSIVQVDIGLDLSTEQVLKIYSDYPILQNMERDSNL